MSEVVRNDDLLLRARADLAQAAQTMSAAAKEMGDQLNAAGLQLMIPRLKQGLVRVAVLGVTSSGKSALINALLGDLIVPENPNVSSPIPVWIGYEDGQPKVTIYKSREDSAEVEAEALGIPQFQMKYCYNASHFKKRDEDHFGAVRYGSVSVDSPSLKDGMVLVDTLGIAASDIDTAKTLSVLEEGVDLVLFVTRNFSFSKMEIDFLQDYVLGIHPDKHRVAHPVAPRNILYAVNPFGLSPVPIKAAVKESLRAVYGESGLHEQEIDALCERNVYYVHALKGRYGACGVYPYVDRAPAGSTEKDLKALGRREDEEQAVLAGYDSETLIRESGMEALRQGLAAHVRRQSYGADSAVVRRIWEMSRQAANVQLAASNRLHDMSNVETALQNTKETCAALEAIIVEDAKRITEALDNRRQNYTAALAKVYSDSYKKMKDECVGMAAAAPMPDDFQMGWLTFRGMTETEKQTYISGFLPPLTGMIQTRCVEQVVKMMMNNKPGEELEASLEVVRRVGEALEGHVRRLKESGADAIGVSLPTKEAIEALHVKMKNELREGVSDAIKQSIAEAGARFHQRMDSYVKQVKWNLLFDFLPHGKHAFWEKVCMQVLKPLAEELMAEVLAIADSTEKSYSTLAQKVAKCYGAVENELLANFTSLITNVKVRIHGLEEMIGQQRKATDEELKKYQDLQESCRKLNERLDEWADVFLSMASE